MAKPRFFKTPADFRRWLERNHAKETELLVGFYKVDSGKPSITWPQSVDEALCFGWIDGVRRSVDDISYSIRFTPRKPRSNWSTVNIKRATELSAAGLMAPAGLAAFERRDEKLSEVYAYERKSAALPADAEKKFKADKKAWENFSKMPPGYRRLVSHWVGSAKREETREKRLAELIALSRRGERIPQLTPSPPAKKKSRRST
jgi:uncharacterized protein YdeI (YjbR/CyaY-like superfamily)